MTMTILSPLPLATTSSRRCLYISLMIVVASITSAATIEYNFTLDQYMGDTFPLSPDCQNAWEQGRWLFLANNGDNNSPSFPGPTIEATEGDTIRVTVSNLNEELAASLHWHGIHQKGTPYSDGASQITQCPLDPLISQTYEFIAYPPGTHYWHSHQSMTAADGLAGAVIIHPKPREENTNINGTGAQTEAEIYGYDEERVLLLSDYYGRTSVEQTAGLASEPFKWVGNPDSLLLNGKGLARKCTSDAIKKAEEDYEDGSAQWPICLDTCDDTLSWTTSIMVEKGKTYRFRIINGGGLIMQNFAIFGHNMTVIEAEGTMVEPLSVSNLTLSPGQRYSVLVTADQGNNEEENFWMESTVMGRANLQDLYGRFILSYANSTEEVQLPSLNDLPKHPQWDEDPVEFVNQLATQDVKQYPEELAALTADESDIERYHMVLTQGYDENRKMHWALNNITFHYPTGEPLIKTAHDQAQLLGWPLDGPMEGTVDMPRKPPTVWNSSQSMLSEGGPGENIGERATSVVRLNEGDIVEFVFENSVSLNNVSEFHPWHLHGHSFWIVGRGQGSFDAERDVPNYNLENPVLRDTVNHFGHDWVAIRFVANNPGVWYLHCHIEPHLYMGMGFVVIVEPNQMGPLSDSAKYCSEQGLSVGEDNSRQGVSGATSSIRGYGGVDSEQGVSSGGGRGFSLSWVLAIGSFMVLFGVRG